MEKWRRVDRIVVSGFEREMTGDEVKLGLSDCVQDELSDEIQVMSSDCINGESLDIAVGVLTDQ